jgi:hypothetical protein
MGQPPQDGAKTLALNLLAAAKAVPTSVSAGTSTGTDPERDRQLPEPESRTSTSQVACGSAASAERPDVVGEAKRIFEKAWQLSRNLEAEGDNRGAVAALRVCRESLDTLTELLRQSTVNDLAGVSDESILREAKHRNLKTETVVKLIYADDPPRDPDVSRGA